MSDFKHKENTGTLFRQDKGGNEKRPDYRGVLNVEGRDLELAGWVREGKSGKFLSLKVQEPRKREGYKPPVSQAPQNDPDDDLPFAWAFAVPIAGLLAGAIYAQDLLQVWA